jgi:hypothetical protein
MLALRDTVEERLIREAGGRVQRSGCELRISLREGPPAIFQNDIREGDSWLTYRYAGPVPAVGLELVKVQYYEGGPYLLLSAGGGRTIVAGVPVVAPDSSGFFTTSLDLEAEYDPNVIEVWSMQSGSPRLELAVRSEEWGPSEARWVDSATIEFLRTFPFEAAGQHRTAKARLQRSPRGWMFEPLEP